MLSLFDTLAHLFGVYLLGLFVLLPVAAYRGLITILGILKVPRWKGRLAYGVVFGVLFVYKVLTDDETERGFSLGVAYCASYLAFPLAMATYSWVGDYAQRLCSVITKPKARS